MKLSLSLFSTSYIGHVINTGDLYWQILKTNCTSVLHFQRWHSILLLFWIQLHWFWVFVSIHLMYRNNLISTNVGSFLYFAIRSLGHLIVLYSTLIIMQLLISRDECMNVLWIGFFPRHNYVWASPLYVQEMGIF